MKIKCTRMKKKAHIKNGTHEIKWECSMIDWYKIGNEKGINR